MKTEKIIFILVGVVGLAALYFVTKKISGAPSSFTNVSNFGIGKPNKNSPVYISDNSSPMINQGGNLFDASKQNGLVDIVKQVETQFA